MWYVILINSTNYWYWMREEGLPKSLNVYGSNKYSFFWLDAFGNAARAFCSDVYKKAKEMWNS